MYKESNYICLYSLANGDVIVTVLPVNQKWPWITPALFRPEVKIVVFFVVKLFIFKFFFFS